MQYQKGWQPPTKSENTTTLNEYDAKELRIIKQAVLKSAIEGGVIKKKQVEETDEEFLSRWIKWIYSNTQKDKELTDQEIPF